MLLNYNNILNNNMKSVSLALAVVAISSLVSAQNQWPEGVTIPYSFKANGAINTWDGTRLTAFQGVSGSLLADSTRNKAAVHGKMAVPLIGSAEGHFVFDFTKRTMITYIPILGMCKSSPLNATVNLKDMIRDAQDPNGGMSTYLGELAAPWDKATATHKF